MRRLLAPAILALALTGVVAGPALAAPPDREPLELPPSIDFAAGEACSFDLRVDILANKGWTTTYFDRSGAPVRAIGTGSLKIRATNIDDADEPSVTLNISGPIHTWFHADGSSTSVYGGRSASLYPVGTFILTAGRAVVQLDASGEFVSVTNIGFEQDICATIAG